LGRPVQQGGAHDDEHGDDERESEQCGEGAAHPTTVASPAMATLQSVAPIFPTADLDAMARHYEALGFSVQVHGGGYGTAARDGLRVHFRLVPHLAPLPADLGGHEAPGRGAAYFGVDDADALHAEWSRAGVGHTSELFDPGFGVWEAAHTDCDGNLLRFGSPVRRT
jgi:Glyoxalase/Bleomycin resistance protein/Dioxygenase superfamily